MNLATLLLLGILLLVPPVSGVRGLILNSASTSIKLFLSRKNSVGPFSNAATGTDNKQSRQPILKIKTNTFCFH